MLNVLDEPKLIQKINTEYYKLINFYSNIKRPSVFIKYYNLALDVSPSDEISAETYDFYTKTQNQWDVYDITPTQIIGAIQNTPESVPDMKGQSIISATTILTYTIDSPRVGDLVTFYKPSESEEVLRVVNVRLQLNSNYATVPVKWFELDLETAPIRIESLGQLNLRYHYVYDLSIEKNFEYTYYKEYVKAMNKLKELLKYFNKFYSPINDLYLVNDKIYCELNELIYLIKKNFNNKYVRLFEEVKSPFGYWDKHLYGVKLKDLNEQDLSSDEFTYFDSETLEKKSVVLGRTELNEDEESCLVKVKELLSTVQEMKEHIQHVR